MFRCAVPRTSKKGIDSDRAYIGDHKEDISEFEKEVKDGKDAQIKMFATTGVPILGHHLAMAKSLNEKLNLVINKYIFSVITI